MRTTGTSAVVSRLAAQGHLIGGTWRASHAAGTHAHHYAATGRVQAEVGLAGPADVVLSDMAPNTTGHAATDHLRIMALAELALHFAMQVLVPGGSFVAKVFQGGSEREMLEPMKRHFAVVRHAKPPASRKESSELYVVATGFRGR